MIISFYKLKSMYLIIVLIECLYLHNYLRIGAPMDLMTKDLLINFLFILLSLCLAQILYMIKYSYQLKESNDRIIAIFPAVSIILSMLFPVYVDENFIWDLRWIPFILGGLYGGYKLGSSLLLIILFIRYFQGGDGFYITVITFTLVGIIVSLLSKYYLQMRLKHKIIVTTSLSIFSLLCSFILSFKVFFIDLHLSFWLQYSGIHIIGMVLLTLLWEMIRTNFQVLQKLIKAEKLQTVSHLAASMSHEVRNPLTAVRGFIQLLSEDTSTYSRKDYADIALSELDRATEVINDYLTFAKPVLEKEEKLNTNEEIQHAVNVITPLATMNGVQVKLSLLEHHLCFTKGERKKFQQCLINLLKNGIESMQPTGELHISQTYSNGMIEIHIQDQGKGMTKEQINRLGEPYFTTKEKGTGLGMMVSYSIIKGMNGTIDVTSEIEKGTRFILKLPIIHS